jgi:hypothetical protein
VAGRAPRHAQGRHAGGCGGVPAHALGRNHRSIPASAW